MGQAIENVKPRRSFVICQPDNERRGGTAPHVGPRRRAVISYMGRWYPAPVDPAMQWDGDLMSGIEWCQSLGWVGAEIRCVGNKRPDARINPPYSYRALLAVAEGIRIDGLEENELPMTA